MKGVSDRIAASILVGDATLAASPAFAALRAAQDRLILALQSGAPLSGPAEDCRALCLAVEPGLVGFFDRMVQRPDDYRDQRAAIHQAAMPR